MSDHIDYFCSLKHKLILSSSPNNQAIAISDYEEVQVTIEELGEILSSSLTNKTTEQVTIVELGETLLPPLNNKATEQVTIEELGEIYIITITDQQDYSYQ